MGKIQVNFFSLSVGKPLKRGSLGIYAPSATSLAMPPGLMLEIMWNQNIFQMRSPTIVTSVDNLFLLRIMFSYTDREYTNQNFCHENYHKLLHFLLGENKFGM